MEVILQTVIALGSVTFIAFIAFVFFLGRWAYRDHGITAGYWIAGCLLWSRLFGLVSHWATRHLLDFYQTAGEVAVPLSQLVALLNYAQLVFGSLGQLVLAVLLGAELVHRLQGSDNPTPGFIARLGALQAHRNALGACALFLFSGASLVAVAALAFLSP